MMGIWPTGPEDPISVRDGDSWTWDSWSTCSFFDRRGKKKEVVEPADQPTAPRAPLEAGLAAVQSQPLDCASYLAWARGDAHWRGANPAVHDVVQ